MGHLFIVFAIAASLLLGACGSDVEESADTPVVVVEESADTPVAVVEEPADTPPTAVEESTETSISVVELADRIQAGSSPFVLDIRVRNEYARSHIPGAISIPLRELPSRLAELPSAKSEEIVVVSGHRLARARRAEETLRGSGYSNVRLFAGHYKAWVSAGLPTE